MSEERKSKSTLRLPLLVTKGLVLFPQMSDAIEAARAFSVAAISMAKETTNNLIFVVSQKKPELEEIGPDDINEVGTLARIVSLSSHENSFRVKLIGSKRVHFDSILFEEGSFIAEGSVLETVKGNEADEAALVRNIIATLESSPYIGRDIPRNVLSEMGKTLSNEELSENLASYLPLKAEEKQELLEETNLNDRLAMLNGYIEGLKASEELEGKLANTVREKAEKNQREYILREKMKAIREELGEDNEHTSETILDKLEKNPYPEGVKNKVKSELRRYEMMPDSSLEASLIMSYIDNLMNVPWFQKTEDNDDLENVKKILDEDHYGLEKVKKRIVEYLAVKKMTGTLKAPILCFYGPPGCGKTSLAKSIARALGRKFFKASLGGVTDESEIRGHRRTYVGSMPGRIIQGMTRAGTVNPVFLLDEIDKVGNSSYRGDPSSALLEVLDPEQNIAFNDNYIEEPYDLSNVLFIATANYLENVPAPLRDRLELIEVPSYTEIEKIKIAAGFLLGKQAKANGLKEDDIVFDKEAYEEIIRFYTREAGVRELERLIASICRKVVVDLLTDEKAKRPVHIDAEKVKKYLGVEIFDSSKKEKDPQIGVITGLAYTEYGGDILPIEVTHFPGKGGLVLTGKLGDVMKESATIALDYVRANADRYHIDSSIFKEDDVHIHVPEGAVPKDGPSAGVAITCAIISGLSKTYTDNNVAMTGEVTLRGQALPIGGLREKSLAALRSGIKTIVVPIDNKKDVSELPQEVKDSLNIVFMKSVDDALKVALPSLQFEAH